MTSIVGIDMYPRLAALFTSLEEGLYERGNTVRLCILAAIASESVFLLGPPGVAKSLIARRLQNAFADARCFDYLMGRFSTPEEIFGPVSINRLKNEDVYVRRTERYLPEADIVFLDEIWKASPPIQNALLTALNEKIFRNGTEEIKLPLKLLIAASNETAHDEASQAFWDRFLVRIELEPLASDDAFLALITDLNDPYRDVVDPKLKIDLALWQKWQTALNAVIIGPTALKIFLELRKQTAILYSKSNGPYISDRRWKKCGILTRASALAHNRTTVEAIDCFVLTQCLWNKPEEQALIQKLVERIISEYAEENLTVDQSLRSQLTDLRNHLQGTSVIETSAEIPLIADDEYYILDGLPADLLLDPKDINSSLLEARIWRPDFEALAEHGNSLATAIFVYHQGIFLKSIEKQCAWGAGWTLMVQNVPFTLKTDVATIKETSSKPLKESDRKIGNQKLTEFITDCNKEAENIQVRLSALRQEAQQHFFAPPQALDLLSRNLKTRLSVLAQLETEAHECREHNENG